VERDKMVLCAGRIEHAASFAGELDSGFVGFGTGVTDEDAGGIVHCAGRAGLFDEEFGERAGPGVMVEVGGVYEGACLGGVSL